MIFDHIGIKVLDMKTSIEFYTLVLGAIVERDEVYPMCRLVFLNVAGTVIELIGKEDNAPRSFGPIEHIAFKVDNLTQEMLRLDGLGIHYTEPMQIGSNEIIFFEGPNNERFEFLSPIKEVSNIL